MYANVDVKRMVKRVQSMLKSMGIYYFPVACLLESFHQNLNHVSVESGSAKKKILKPNKMEQKQNIGQ